MKLFKIEKADKSNADTKLNNARNQNISNPNKNYKNRFYCYKQNLFSQKFLVKKAPQFRLYKHNNNKNQIPNFNEGRWKLKEHIVFLQGIQKFGTNWIKISQLIPKRTYKQIRSHAQKFFERLKGFKDAELGIDFTSENIRNINDMISQIKSINKDYNIITVFLYLSEKYSLIKNPNKKAKTNIININITNILCEDITKNIINNFDVYNKNDNSVNNIKGINNNINFINDNANNSLNMNYFNDINNLFSIAQVYSNYNITSNFVNNILLQNIPCNNIDVYNNYSFNKHSMNLLDKKIENSIDDLAIFKNGKF